MPAKNESFYGTTGISGYWLTLMVDGTQYDKIAVYANETVTADMVAYNVPTGYSFSGWRTTDSRPMRTACEASGFYPLIGRKDWNEG